MIKINQHISLDENEIRYTFVRAAGPGGQNINKVATAAQLRFDVSNSPSLPEEVKRRLVKLAGRRLTSEGVLVIEARRYRTQAQNRRDALARFVALIHKAARRPKKRIKTKPSRASMEERFQAKMIQSKRKKIRRENNIDFEKY